MLDNLRGMAVFASVVEHGSFSGSARELGITTSAVSQQIRSLETSWVYYCTDLLESLA